MKKKLWIMHTKRVSGRSSKDVEMFGLSAVALTAAVAVRDSNQHYPLIVLILRLCRKKTDKQSQNFYSSNIPFSEQIEHSVADRIAGEIRQQ